MKSITFIANLETFGGVETVFFTYAKMLSKQYKIKLVSVYHIPSNICCLCEQQNICYMHPFPKVKWNAPFQKLLYLISKGIFTIKALTWLQSSDIIIDFKNGQGYNLIKKTANNSIPKILWFHGGMPCVEKIMRKKNCAIYDKIVVLTDSLKEKLMTKFPEHKDKFVRVYNPIDLEKIARMAEETTVDTKNENFFAHVSRLDIDKDIKTLIDGYNVFYRKHQEILTPPHYFIL